MKKSPQLNNFLYVYDVSRSLVNPLIGTLKLKSNGPLYSNKMIGTLAVDELTVTFCTARRGLGGLRPRPVFSSLYLKHKGLTRRPYGYYYLVCTQAPTTWRCVNWVLRKRDSLESEAPRFSKTSLSRSGRNMVETSAYSPCFNKSRPSFSRWNSASLTGSERSRDLDLGCECRLISEVSRLLSRAFSVFK